MAALLLGAAFSAAQQGPKTNASLGEQLYSTHCVTCHTSEVHWRDKRIAKDWPGLVAQVRRWQSNSGLDWSEDDIREVARYLNSRYYHFAGEDKRASVSSPNDRLDDASISLR
jgi:mono/diheme cytochrome c family protein